MHIAFLCSSLEPGRDGVGDYTRRLAAECVRHGHSCQIVALNDHGSDEPAELGRYVHEQETDCIPVRCLRLPHHLDWKTRLRLTKAFLAEFAPDWISLQYVCYGYHPKGIPLRWNAAFAELSKLARHRHIMFHELWIGVFSTSTWKHQVLGLLQKYLIRNLLVSWKPSLVDTSIPKYVDMLMGIRARASLLPLFGAIPVLQSTPQSDSLCRQLLEHSGLPSSTNRESLLIAIHFGTLHPDWEHQVFFNAFLAECRQKQKMGCILAVGRMGARGEELFSALELRYSPKIAFLNLGPQSTTTISHLLKFSDFGITTGLNELLGKSSTFATMVEHGLKVVSPLASGNLSRIRSGDITLDSLFDKRWRVFFRHNVTTTFLARTSLMLLNSMVAVPLMRKSTPQICPETAAQ